MIALTDTHCHIHFDDYGLEPELALKNALKADVNKMILVGCTLKDSESGVTFAQKYDQCFASVGLHPHEGLVYANDESAILELQNLARQPKVVAIGECGLDYYYNNAPKAEQKWLFKKQLEIAEKLGLPVIFHVRDAFDDFFSIIDDYPNVKGVVHSFTACPEVLEGVIARNLYVGLNGIMTFTKDEKQLQSARLVPLDNLMLETDAPFLTPKPFRGKVCEPKHVRVTAEFLGQLRGESLELIAQKTTQNAINLFGL